MIAFPLVFVGFSLWVHAEPSPNPSAPRQAAVAVPARGVPTPAAQVEAQPGSVATTIPAVIASPAAAPPEPRAATLEVESQEGSVLRFRTTDGSPKPKPLNLGLPDPKVLGFLDPGPHVLVGNRDGIYLVPVDGGKPVQFVYPGKIFDPKTRALMIESRAFFGQCLSGGGDVYVVFQREKVDRRSRLQSSVFVAEPGPQMVHEKLIERRLPSIDATLRRTRGKGARCREIEGRNRLMLAKPLDLKPRRGDDDREDDEDENDKERDKEPENISTS